MACRVDFHVLAQAVIYFLSVACGLVVAIPVGITMAQYDRQCVLYADFTWDSQTRFYIKYSSRSNCTFSVYLCVFAAILYPLGVGIYQVYALTRKDPTIGARMWIMPFVLINVLIAITVFISACIISVGFKTFCDNFLDHPHGGNKSCKHADRILTEDGTVRSGSFYEFMRTAEIASWALFLDWLIQVGLGVARMIRSRYQKPEDMSNITEDTSNHL